MVAASRPIKKLINRNFYLLWQGQTISRLGDQMYQIAMLLWIKDLTDSATIVGLILMASSIPGVLLGPIGGTFADRYSRRKILLACDMIMGIGMLILAVLSWFNGGGGQYALAWLVLIAIVNGIIEAFFSPAISSAIPDLVPKDRVAAANSMAQFSVQAALFFGQGLGGTLFRILGGPVIFMITGLSYLFASLNDFLLRIPQRKVAQNTDFNTHLKAFKKDMLDGLRYVWAQTGLKQLVILSAVMNFFSVPIIVLLPFFVEDSLKVTVDWYGFLLAAYGVGSMLGYVAAGVWTIKGRMRAALIFLMFFVQSAGYGFLGMAGTAPLALSIVFLGGIVNGLVTIYVTTILQTHTPSEIRGRIFGLLGTIAGSLAPVAMGLSGIIADLLNQNIRLMYVGSSLILVFVIGGMALSPSLWTYLAQDPIPARAQKDPSRPVKN